MRPIRPRADLPSQPDGQALLGARNGDIIEAEEPLGKLRSK